MSEANDTVLESIITQNKEQWGRLLFLLKDPEPNILWVNCDTAFIKKPLHNAVTAHFPHLKPYDIYVNEKTESLTKIILWEDKDKIPQDAIIHIFGMEDAVKSAEFLGNVNFQRDSLFRRTPATIIFWTDFATGTVLAHKAYDFWSWVFFTFDFITPRELLTARQKGFQQELELEDTIIQLPSKDSDARIKHLENEWDEFLKSVNRKPSTKKQMKDAVTIALTMAMEYRDAGDFRKFANIIQEVFSLNSTLINDVDNINLRNALGNALLEVGEIGKAQNILEETLKIALKEYGEHHTEVATLRLNLATVYRQIGKFNDAETLLKAALYEYVNNLGENDVNVAICKSVLGLIYCDIGHWPEAKVLLERALEIDTLNYGENHPNVATRYSNLAHVYRDIKQYDKAREFMQKAYEIRKMVLGESNAKTINTLNFLQELEDESRPTS